MHWYRESGPLLSHSIYLFSYDLHGHVSPSHLIPPHPTPSHLKPPPSHSAPPNLITPHPISACGIPVHPLQTDISNIYQHVYTRHKFFSFEYYISFLLPFFQMEGFYQWHATISGQIYLSDISWKHHKMMLQETTWYSMCGKQQQNLGYKYHR